MNESYPSELVRHVAATTGLDEATAMRIVADTCAYFGETVEEWVRRRHTQLRERHLKNDDIWPRLMAELPARRFRAPTLSERQLRRMVYG
jgi:hypothetical protein